MDFWENLLNFITDRNRRLSSKAAVGILILFFIFIIDNVTGFSYYYNKSRQLEQLETIKILLSDSTLSKETRVQLLSLESKVLKRESIIDNVILSVKKISSSKTEESQSYMLRGENSRNNILFIASSSGLYILIAIILLPILFISDKRTPWWKLLASMLIFIIVLFGTGWFYYWLFDMLLPDELWGSWTWNYIVNFLLQIGLFIATIYASVTITKIDN